MNYVKHECDDCQKTIESHEDEMWYFGTEYVKDRCEACSKKFLEEQDEANLYFATQF